jgi:hypothetical protein
MAATLSTAIVLRTIIAKLWLRSISVSPFGFFDFPVGLLKHWMICLRDLRREGPRIITIKRRIHGAKGCISTASTMQHYTVPLPTAARRPTVFEHNMARQINPTEVSTSLFHCFPHIIRARWASPTSDNQSRDFNSASRKSRQQISLRTIPSRAQTIRGY